MKNSINIIKAILVKERTDLLYNKKMLLIMFIFPVIYLIISNIAENEFGSDGAAFILMHSILVPLQIMASIIAEEKEKGTLKMLMLSGVRAVEYFIGIAIVIMMFLVMGMLVFDLTGATQTFDSVAVVFLTVIVFVCSMIIGSLIGCVSDNQVSIGSLTVPITLVLFFLPVIGTFNKNLEFLGKYLYSGVLFEVMNTGKITTENTIVMIVNVVTLLIIFVKLFNTKYVIKRISK